MSQQLQEHTALRLMTICKIRSCMKNICCGIWIRFQIAHTGSLQPDETSQIYDSNTYVREYTYLGIIGKESDGRYRIEQRNKFSVGETIEIMKPDGQNIETVVRAIINEDGETQESAPHSKQVLYIELDKKAEKYDILRRAEDIEA